MKIAIISSGFLPVVDGVTIALYHRLRILSKQGYQVLVLCPDYQPLASVYPHWGQQVGQILPGVTVIGLPSEPFMGVEFERNISRRGNQRLQQELHAFQPDVIHVDEPDRLFLGVLNAPGVAYAKAHTIPCIGFYHTNFVDYIEDFFPLPGPIVAVLQWISTQIIRRVFESYDVTLVASPITQARVQRLGIRNTRCDRFLGVDLAAFHDALKQPQFFKTQYGIEGIDDKITLIFLGRLTPDKGWGFTLKALADWAKHPDYAPWVEKLAVVIAGDGELRHDIHHMLQDLGFAVHLLGRISPDVVPEVLVNSDIHVTASEKETLGLTVLEAFAACIPVMAPRAGGVVTHLRDGENGLLFEPRDSDAFGRSLYRLISDAELRQRLGQQGRADVEAYHWEAAVNRLVKAWIDQRDNGRSPS
ncbi:MAG: glycosyltransferase [Cyanobacteria bacterium J06627_8]